MKKSKRLQPVRQLKQQEERTQAKKLADIQQGLAAARNQLTELESYLADYFSTATHQQRQIQSAAQLGQYQIFISKLKEAIERQKQDIKQREKALQAQTKNWFEASNKLKTMDELIEKARQQEEREEDQKEQKLLDDRPGQNRSGFQ